MKDRLEIKIGLSMSLVALLMIPMFVFFASNFRLSMALFLLLILLAVCFFISIKRDKREIVDSFYWDDIDDKYKGADVRINKIEEKSAVMNSKKVLSSGINNF